MMARHEVMVACASADYVTCNMEFWDWENRVGEDKRRWKGVKDGSVGDDLYVSRMIGHTYLKSSGCNCEPLLAWFRIPRPFHKPIPCPEPSIEEHRLCVEYQFVLFASEGLWEHLSNHEAVDIYTSVPLHASDSHTLLAVCRIYGDVNTSSSSECRSFGHYEGF